MPAIRERADSVRWYGSGATSDGGAQPNPDLSLGNFRSSTEITWLSPTVTSPISGITVLFVGGKNGIGDGTLAVTGADAVRWTAPGGTPGTPVTILNGQTMVLEDGADPAKYVRISRTTASALSGTATVSLAYVFNNSFGFDNVTSAESSGGDNEYRLLVARNENAASIGLFKVCISTLGTQRLSDVGQLPASGAGSITTAGSFADWPTTGFCHIKSSGGGTREIVYYSARTATELTVPATGRAMLGTSSAAGAGTDTLDAVPGIRLAVAAPSGSNNWPLIANENTAPAGVAWGTPIDVANALNVGTLAVNANYGMWVHRQIPAGYVNSPQILNAFLWFFDA